MTRRWAVVSFAGVLAAFSCIAVSSAPSNAQATAPSGLAVLHVSASPPPPANSLALGPLSSSADVHLDVTLKLPDPSAVTSFIASLSDRHSANFHHFLRPGQFGRLSGPRCRKWPQSTPCSAPTDSTQDRRHRTGSRSR